jgi:hypothetical protein
MSEEIKNPITYLEKPVYEMDDDELHELFDVNWYPKANKALTNQRLIWDYSYLAYKGIMTNAEINYKRRKNGYALSVNVPRTFATIEGIRKNFNINKLELDLEKQPGVEFNQLYKVRSLLNYDLNRSKTRKQVKDAGFDKLVFGNGFLYSFLMDRKSKAGKIVGKIDEETGRVKVTTADKLTSRYYGMVARRISPYNIFPDPDGTHHDVDNVVDRMCAYTCIRSVKHISTFKRDWTGVIPKKLLDKVIPGGKDMTNYEAVRKTIDYLFNPSVFEKNSTVQQAISSSKISVTYDDKEFVEERLWVGEDFLVLQAGKGLPFLMVSCNANPEKKIPLEKLNDVEVPGEYFSMGEPYVMRYQQVEENRIHNSVLDLLHFSVSQMIGVNTQYLQDPTDTEIYPGKVWKFKAIPGAKISDAIQFSQPSSSAIAPALKFMQEVKQTGQQATAITDFVTGASKSIADTATESNRLSSASDITIVDKIREMVAGALTNIAQNWLAQYPIVYSGEKLELAYAGKSVYFVGRKKEKVSEDDIKKILDKGYEAEDIIFLEDLDITNPKLKVVGDIEISKEVKFRQWTTAIDFANNVNKVAFETGDSRRLDTIQMGVDAMANFDVISDPTIYVMAGQETKTDQMAKQAAANNAGANNQEQNGGRPAEPKTAAPRTDTQEMKSNAQPTKV